MTDDIHVCYDCLYCISLQEKPWYFEHWQGACSSLSPLWLLDHPGKQAPWSKREFGFAFSLCGFILLSVVSVLVSATPKVKDITPLIIRIIWFTHIYISSIIYLFSLAEFLNNRIFSLRSNKLTIAELLKSPTLNPLSSNLLVMRTCVITVILVKTHVMSPLSHAFQMLAVSTVSLSWNLSRLIGPVLLPIPLAMVSSRLWSIETTVYCWLAMRIQKVSFVTPLDPVSSGKALVMTMIWFQMKAM